MANGAAANAATRSQGATRADLRSAQARARRPGSPSLPQGAPSALRGMPRAAQPPASEQGAGADLRSEQAAARRRRLGSPRLVQQRRAKQRGDIGFREGLKAAVTPGGVQKLAVKKGTEADAKTARSVSAGEIAQNPIVARTLNSFAFSTLGPPTAFIAPLIIFNIEMFYGYYIARKKSRIVPPFSWDTIHFGSKVKGILPDLLLHAALLAVDILIAILVGSIILVNLYVLTVIAMLIKDPVGVLIGEPASGMPLPEGMLEFLKPLFGL